MKNIFFLLIFLSANAFADMALAKMANSAPALPMHDVPIEEINSKDQNIQKMKSVAMTLDIKSVKAYETNPEKIQVHTLKEAVKRKINENPKWDNPLRLTQLKEVTPHLEMLKNTFGEKSYEWAWFLKQTGKTEESKTLLQDLFTERSNSVMRLKGTYNGQSPLAPVSEIKAALEPISSESEKANLKKKMNELKIHISNLKDYTIMT